MQNTTANASPGGWFEERARLAGTVAVITGGAGGLGEAIVRDLAANGVRPAVSMFGSARIKPDITAPGVDVIAAVSPQEGFLHPTNVTDTLGFDKPETKCKFK